MQPTNFFLLMLLSLPLLHATLLPCVENWIAMPATAAGRYCARCEHVVHDFSQAADLAVAFVAAQAAALGGQVCGRFAAAQVVAPRLQLRLQRFLVALVLVFGLGLPAHEALAQVRQVATTVKPARSPAHRPRRRPVGAQPTTQLAEVPEEIEFIGGIGPESYAAQEVVAIPLDTVLTYAEQMPALPGGTFRELPVHIQHQMRWPAGSGRICAEGRVYVQFVVGKSGLVRDVKVLKGLEPTFDAEAVRAVQTLGRLQPGRQKGWAVAVTLTLPVSFNRE